MNLKSLCLAIALIIFSQPTSLIALEDDNLEYKKWYVESIGDFKGPHLGHAIFESGKITGVSTCNIFFGVYEIIDTKLIKFSRMAVGAYDTKAICKLGNKMELEEKFIDGLETVKSYKIEAEKLILFAAEDKEFARFYLKKKK